MINTFGDTFIELEISSLFEIYENYYLIRK